MMRVYLDHENRLRRDHALHYDRGLAGLPEVVTPVEADGARHVYHIYAIRVRDRRDLMAALDAKGIGFSVHYPVPIHLQTAYRLLGYEAGDFPVSERCAREFLSLPMFPEMTPEQTAFVTDTIRDKSRALRHGVTPLEQRLACWRAKSILNRLPLNLMQKSQSNTPKGGFGVQDVLFVLFKHKWKILLLSLVGFGAAAAVFFIQDPIYQSESKLLVRYVLERGSVDPYQSQTSPGRQCRWIA